MSQHRYKCKCGIYEQDVNQTFLLGASRKGEELDVAGNSRDQ